MASCKGMPAIAFIEFADMQGEIDLRTLPMGTLIITIQPIRRPTKIASI